MMKQSLFNSLVHSRIVRSFEKSFPVATGFAIKVQPADASSKMGPFGAYASPFCRLMSRSASARAVCNKSFAAIRKKAAQSHAPSCSCCFAKITHVAVPVMSAGDHIATIYGGQLLLENPTQHAFAKISRYLVHLGLESTLPSLERAWFSLPVVSEEQLQAMIYLLENFADQLSQVAVERVFEPIAGESINLTRAREFIHSNFADPISVGDAAADLQVSISTYSKLFRDTLGLTFTQYLTRYRVEKTKGLLADPARKICDIAHQSGFESVSQFNRSFRRCVGMSPSQYRSLLEGADPLHHLENADEHAHCSHFSWTIQLGSAAESDVSLNDGTDMNST